MAKQKKEMAKTKEGSKTTKEYKNYGWLSKEKIYKQKERIISDSLFLGLFVR
jgi:hypothetical protein